MKIAVLGAKGFLGSFLCDYFANSNHQIVPVYKSTIDLTDHHQVQLWLKTIKPDVVINCTIAGGLLNVDAENFQNFQENLNIFLNFYNSDQNFRFINIGSGAEFDRQKDINICREEDIFISNPSSSYGYMKNITARLSLNRSNFFTLRLFGCFHPSEAAFRLFPKFLSSKKISIMDRYFDYFSVEDFALVVDHYISTATDNLTKDINCVYLNKLKLSEILLKFSEYHCPTATIEIESKSAYNYTGDGTKLARMNLPLSGLYAGLRNYV